MQGMNASDASILLHLQALKLSMRFLSFKRIENQKKSHFACMTWNIF
jgi:hypothetical protein